jgi:uncharacterized protein
MSHYKSLFLYVLFLCTVALSLWTVKRGLAAQDVFRTICSIQGDGATSPYNNKSLTTRGIVYADMDDTSRRGFYIQDDQCDGNPNTSDGIFIYLAERRDVVKVGDEVDVQGQVIEYFGMTEIDADADHVTVRSSGNPLPDPVPLNPPMQKESSRQYFETLEGMYVKMDEAVTVGPTDGSGWSWVVAVDQGVQRVFWDDPRGTGEIVCIGEKGAYQVDPQVRVGDHILNVRGAVDYILGIYCLQLFSEPRVLQVSSMRGGDDDSLQEDASTAGSASFHAATLNMYNLFDTEDDPATEDSVLSASEYQRKLQKRALVLHDTLNEPEIVALQEVENEAVLQALILRPELEAEYGYIWENGPDKRGLDIALIYRRDRVQAQAFYTRQGCTALVDGLGPDGNGDVKNPQNNKTCDRNGDGIMDGNRLFSRPPLVVRVRVCHPDCVSAPDRIEWLVTLVTVHFKSKIEDSASTEYTLPRRIEQAEFVAGLAGEIREDGSQDHILVLGDVNDRIGTQPLDILHKAGLGNGFEKTPREERFTYNYQGISQDMDHILVDLAPPLACVETIPFHINADYPVVFDGVNGSIHRSSDHDPLMVRLQNLDIQHFIPVVYR